MKREASGSGGAGQQGPSTDPSSGLFTPTYRDTVRTRVLALAEADGRVIGAAEVGSRAGPAGGDRWSDIDLTFSVADGILVQSVVADWATILATEFGAVTLFDLPVGRVIYRVFLFPGCLQVDLSFGPPQEFGARGPNFTLLFGRAEKLPLPTPPPADVLFGYAVHHALRARFCVERGRLWQGEYWVSEVRRYGLDLACLKRGLATSHARGYDHLPGEVLDRFAPAFARRLEAGELLRALAVGIECLLAEAGDAQALADRTTSELRKLGTN